MTVRTCHGRFAFRRLRFLDSEGKNHSLFPFTTSLTLQQRCIDWATRFSFSEVEALLHEFCGSALLSEDTIWRIVQQEAHRYDAEQGQLIQSIAQRSEEALPQPNFVAANNIYEEQSKEFVTLTDGICVPSQKPTREKTGQEKCQKEAKRHETNVFILPRPDGGEQFFCDGLSQSGDSVSSVSAFLRQEWSGVELSVVAITDGARKIRSDLGRLFGEGVRIILDWYHLAKRVTENLSMVAHSMKEREEWEEQMLGFLWQGNTSEAMAFLSSVTARREKAKADLLGYLQKHSEEIIDYGRRQKVGKPIGSGRMEKGVDQVIGLRQKNRGMSWTKEGSRALALLTVAKLNARCPIHP